jgi:hypothetical protein
MRIRDDAMRAARADEDENSEAKIARWSELSVATVHRITRDVTPGSATTE